MSCRCRLSLSPWLDRMILQDFISLLDLSLAVIHKLQRNFIMRHFYHVENHLAFDTLVSIFCSRRVFFRNLLTLPRTAFILTNRIEKIASITGFLILLD